MRFSSVSFIHSVVLYLSFSFAPVRGTSSHSSVISKRLVHHRSPASFSNDLSLNVTNRDSLDDQPDLRKRDGTKYVFMHHIVGNTYGYDYNAWSTDFTLMLAKQIDAVALNIGSDSWQLAQISTAYNAAAAVGMKLFISFDYTAFPCDVSQTVNYVNQFQSSPAQFKVNGRPMISSYSGYCLGTGGWQSIKLQTGGFLMPFFYGQDDNTLRSTGSFSFLDSWYCWGCAWPQGNYPKNTNDDNYYLGVLGSRYATTLSGWIYTHFNYAGKNFYLRGDDWLILSRWEELVAMRNQLTFVEMVTWNDFGESDYFGPLTSGLQPDGTTWATGFPHTGFFELSAYYIQAFKTGSYPQITQDVIYFWSRPHPAGITATNDPLPKPSGWDWTSDNLWAAAFCSSTCSVTLQVGTYSQDFNNLPYGVNKLKLPLNAFGSVTVKMVKNGVEVINYTPSDFQYQSWTAKYNYNAYVGYATATAVSTPTSTSASTSTSTSTSTTSTATSTPTPVSGWTSLGCVAEGTTGTRRALTGASYSQNGMTPAVCSSLCAGYQYFGLENGIECYCGNTLLNNGASGAVVSSGSCSATCNGDASQLCGGGWYLSVYKAASFSTPSASGYIGCMSEGTTGTRRALTGASFTNSAMTPAKCQNLCAGYTYSGTEYGSECYCGNTLTNNGATGVIVSDSQCTSVCAGDSSKICGGGYMLSLYGGAGAGSSSSATSSSSASSSSSTSTSSTSTSSAGSPSSTAFSLLGCVAEGTTGTRRALTGASYTSSAMTPAMCQAKCAGYTYAGLEYSSECYCGNSLTNNGASGAVISNSYCSMNCAGDSTQKCGGPYLLTVYSTQSTTTTTSSSSSSWTSQGCYVDNASRILRGVFLDGQTSLTTESCIAACSSQGYTVAGTEYGRQCMCGNALVGASTAASTDCNVKCAGNANEICGGNYRANVYTAPGTTLTRRHAKRRFGNWLKIF